MNPNDEYEDDYDEGEVPSSGKWVAGRGYTSVHSRGKRMRSPLRRIKRLLIDMSRTFRSRFSIFAHPQGATLGDRRRSLVGSLLGSVEGPWGRLILVAILLQLAWMLSGPVVR